MIGRLKVAHRSRPLGGSRSLDEAATADGLQSAAVVFFDLAKAFETARPDLVWQAGVAYGFPLRPLRLTLEAFAY